MNIEILNNVFEKLIKPKYPWIDNFKWIAFSSVGIFDEKKWVNYKLEITSYSDFDYSVKYYYESKISDDIYSLFPMLSPEPNERFWNVQILNKN